MRNGNIDVWWGAGFVLGTLFYILLAAIILKAVKEQPLKVILLGLLTVVVGTWYAGLPRPIGIPARELTVNLADLFASQGVPLLSKVGFILVLAGLAGYLLPLTTRSETPKPPGTQL